ncbi:MAG: WD40 repeat domain-containing protein [Myxococcota bacterium]
MSSLVDRYCASPHTGPLTAAAYDPTSGALVTADDLGTVAITAPDDDFPSLIFGMGAPVLGAAAVSIGGDLVAVGDDDGTVAVYKTFDGSCAFEDLKEGPAGRARAMRALAFNPSGTILAALAADGIIRIYDLERWDRLANYQGFGGRTIEFHPEGDRLLVVDENGQPKLLDLLEQAQIDLEDLPMDIHTARFIQNGRGIAALGDRGITLFDTMEGRIQQSFSASSSSGILTLAVSPDDHAVAAVTGRSVHTFRLPGLEPKGSEKHGAKKPTYASFWDHRGVVVGGEDGVLHRPGSKPTLGPVLCCTGFGDHRVAVHGDRMAVWTKGRQRVPFLVKQPFVEVRIDRDGRLVAALSDDGEGVQAFEARTGRHLFGAGPDTADTPKMEVGGRILACMRSRGGLRWFDLAENSAFELDWVNTFALSGSGTWLAVVTPRGQVRVLDPSTGEDAISAPRPLAEVPVRLVTFVNRRPDLIVLDEQGVLGIYDLSVSVNQGIPAEGRDVLDLKIDVDRLWGITGGQYAALRFQVPENGTASVIYVDLTTGEVVNEVSDLLPYAWVDAETGRILQPARGAAILEIDMWGKEHQVLRALPDGEWVSFAPHGVLEASARAKVQP